MKKIAITMGDPGGIGPEVIIKAVSSPEVKRICKPVIVGDLSILENTVTSLGTPVRIEKRGPPEQRPSDDAIEVIDLGAIKNRETGRATAEGGQACFEYIARAVEMCLSKGADAMVTAPISKEALKMAGLKWPGHTEMIAELTKTDEYAMMLAGGPLKVILVTIHTALRKVPDMVTRANVLKTIRLAKKACDMLGVSEPSIGVAGLNPHAGEAGIFGEEESTEIGPAIQDALREGIPVKGPFPPDTIFRSAYNGEFDIVVCMYHDQGLIPLKMLAFNIGVNVTVGIPIIRTSPDHGTAYDIAGKGEADPSSMIEAIRLAVDLRLP